MRDAVGLWPAGDPLWQETDQGTVEAVQAIAEARGIPMAQVALAWVLRHPIVCAPIVGATKPHHLADAALDVQLTDEETTALEERSTTNPASPPATAPLPDTD